jgi:hypothetical protein
MAYKDISKLSVPYATEVGDRNLYLSSTVRTNFQYLLPVRHFHLLNSRPDKHYHLLESRPCMNSRTEIVPVPVLQLGFC